MAPSGPVHTAQVVLAVHLPGAGVPRVLGQVWRCCAPALTSTPTCLHSPPPHSASFDLCPWGQWHSPTLELQDCPQEADRPSPESRLSCASAGWAVPPSCTKQRQDSAVTGVLHTALLPLVVRQELPEASLAPRLQACARRQTSAGHSSSSRQTVLL